MAFTYGFYNAIDNDRLYNAIQVSRLFDGIIKDGIYMHIGGQFIVKKFNGDNTVLVSSGRAWFNHTWSYNDSDMPLTGDPAELILDRIDAVVIDVWGADNFRVNQLKWVTGTPKSNPEPPTLIRDDELMHWQYPLAYIYRHAMVNQIEQQDITNMVGSTNSPFVTGVLETMDINALLLQWQDQWAQFVINYENTATAWREEQQEILLDYFEEYKQQLADVKTAAETWRTQQQQALLDYFEEFQEQLDEFKELSETDFDTWYQEIKDIMTDDVALNLTLKLNDLTESEFEHYYGMVNGQTVINKETGVITTTGEDAISTTSFSTQNGNKVITTTVIPNEGLYQYTSTTTIVSSDAANTISTTYTKSAKS